ncbi:MAG TPA: RNA 2',3'-cyclic phosphodiesterase [Candidatus Nitrosotenuis sp.]|nr:RNA 2',3'-cyclic phosphodiesterase [Candidatus Nitrosotenuis sp.]
MRAFVAVEITEESVIDSIGKLQSSLKIAAKPVELKNMHFTLLFLGEISEDMSQKVLAQLKTIEFSSFEIGFEGVGAFPKASFPRVVWVGIDTGGAKHLVELAKSVEDKLAVLGFKPDKPFKPHATIFRVKNKIGDITPELSKFAGAKFGTQKVSQIKLKQSVLTPNGPIYSDLGVISAK